MHDNALNSTLSAIYHELHFVKNLLLKQNEQKLGILFDAVYESDFWGRGSGPGSNATLCSGYVAFLQDFFRTRGVKSVVDVGCGDWQFSQNIDFSGISYQGFDVASFVIKANKAKFEHENVKFSLYDGDFATLPGADLLICKDVLMHLPNAKIQAFIDNLPKYKYALITNCNGKEANADVMATGWRYLDLRRPPFNLPCEEVFTIFEHPKSEEYFGKSVLLWEKRGDFA